jgi:2-oxoglutarate dehydrogenase E2 component (dihydrolipoamide succinyltransferase)
MSSTGLYEIKVPPLGESIQEATVARWLKSVGDGVKADEVLAELETDKVTIEVNAPVSGILKEITVAEGKTTTVGHILGLVELSLAQNTPQLAESVLPKQEDIAAQKTVDNKPDAVRINPSPFKTSFLASPPFGQKLMSSAPNPKPAVAEKQAPSVRKIAEEKAIDLAIITGTGRAGRVTKGDMLTFSNEKSSPLESDSSSESVSVSLPDYEGIVSADNDREERVKMTRLRQRIAERLKDAQNTAAILTTFNEVDMSAITSLRNRYKDSFEKKYGVKLGFMSFFVKAGIHALKEIPAMNAQIQGDEIVYKKYYDIGVAVSTPQGLVVPVIRDADLLGFADVEKAIASLGQKARDGKLSMADMTGGTFTLSNGGVFGSLLSTPILNPPQAGILGMHKIQDRPIVIEGKIEIRPMMYLALSYDHRLIDGQQSVSFLVRIKECLENPERLLLGL